MILCFDALYLYCLSQDVDGTSFMVSCTFPIFLSRRSVDEDASLFLHGAVESEVFGKRLVEFFVLVKLVATELI